MWHRKSKKEMQAEAMVNSLNEHSDEVIVDTIRRVSAALESKQEKMTHRLAQALSETVRYLVATDAAVRMAVFRAVQSIEREQLLADERKRVIDLLGLMKRWNIDSLEEMKAITKSDGFPNGVPHVPDEYSLSLTYHDDLWYICSIEEWEKLLVEGDWDEKVRHKVIVFSALLRDKRRQEQAIEDAAVVSD